MISNALQLARRFEGVSEVAGASYSPLILAMLQLDAPWPQDDSVPWCSAFVNFVCWLLDLPRSKSLAARSWLEVGAPTTLYKAVPGFDIVVLSRGAGGHVGFYVRHDEQTVTLYGGNQDDSVNEAVFDRSRVLGVRCLHAGPLESFQPPLAP